MGHLFVSDEITNAITKLTTAGQFIANFTFSPPLNGPEGLALDGGGALYIADTFSARIVKASSNGTQLQVFTTSNPPLLYPEGVYVDLSFNIWIADSGNGRIVQLYPSGAVAAVLSRSSFNPALSNARGVLVDNVGAVYAADTQNGLVQKRSTTGAVITLCSSLSFPQGLAMDSIGNLFIAEGYNNRVTKMSSGTGTPLQYFTTSSPAMSFPTSSTVDGGGNLYVVDQGNGRIVVFPSASPTIPTASPSASSASTSPIFLPLAFESPYGVVSDGLGNLYVSDASTNAIIKMTTAGQFIANFTFSPPLNGPEGLAIDVTGVLYIADTFGARIVKASSNNGTQLQVFTTSNPSLLFPEGVYVDLSFNIWIADSGNGRIVQLYPSGAVAAVLSRSSFSPTLSNARGVLVDRVGAVIVADTENDAVQRRSSAGVLTTLYSGPVEVGFTNGGPQNLCMDWQGNVFFTDFTMNRVVQLSSSTGAVLNAFMSPSPPINPESCAVDLQGNLYVSDASNGRVVVFPNATLPTPTFSTCSYNVNVSAFSGATDSLVATGYTDHFDTNSSILVSPFDLLTFTTSSTWCIGAVFACSNAAGASTQYTSPSDFNAFEGGALVYRFGNATSDANHSHWATVYPLVYPPQSSLSINIVVPSSVPAKSLLWLAMWDGYLLDEGGFLDVQITQTTAYGCASAPLPTFVASAVSSTCVNLLVNQMTAGTTALVMLTDSCQFASITVPELEAYQAAPVCRFVPSGFQSPATLHLNVSSAGNATKGSGIVVSCPLPLLLAVGSYTVQLSLDGGASIPLSPITTSSISASTLTVTSSTNTPSLVSDFSVIPVLQHPYNASIDTCPAGFNFNDTQLFSLSAVPRYPQLTLILEMTYLKYISTSARFGPSLVSQPCLVIASLNSSQSPFTWHVPDLTATVLMKFNISLNQLIAFSVGAYYTQSSNASSNVKVGSLVGFYDSTGLCSPSICSLIGMVSSAVPGPMIVTGFTSVAPAVLALNHTSVVQLLQAAQTAESTANSLKAAGSTNAAVAFAASSTSIMTAAAGIAAYGAELAGGSLYASRANLSASLRSVSSVVGGASVNTQSSCSSLFGDVHIASFDGIHWNFQAVGVYWLIQTPTLLYQQYGVSGFALQLSLQPLSSFIQPGTPAALAWAGVTYMAGVALQADALSGIIQIIPRASISATSGSYFDVYDNGVHVNAAYNANALGSSTSYQLSCATMFYTAPDTLTVTTYTGYTITATSIDGIARLSNLQVCVPSTAFNNTQGLAGSWNNNPNDDFIDQFGFNWYTKYPGNPSVTVIEAGSSAPNDAAGYEAGQTWQVQPQGSFFITVGPPQVGCNITEDDSVVFTMTCLLGGQSNTSNLLRYDVNITQILLLFNPNQLPYVPSVWPNTTLQQLATSACQVATGGQAISSVAVQDCLLDAYYTNSTVLATGPTQTQQTQLLVQSIAPPTIALLSVSLTQANLQIDATADSNILGGACNTLSTNTSNTMSSTSTSTQCAYVAQLSVSGGVFTPLNLASLSTIGVSALTLTLSLTGLLPATSYTVQTALVVMTTASTSQTRWSTLTFTTVTPSNQTGTLCFLMYGLPGNADYPWSASTQLTFSYYNLPLQNSLGTAVQLFNGSGVRTFINKLGVALSSSLSLLPAGSGSSSSDNLLYLNSATPLDSRGLSFNLTSNPLQLPGAGPATLFSQLSVFNSSIGVIEGGSSLIDQAGSAFLSSVAGFSAVTIGASNINSLAVNYTACQAPISFINGLRQPVQPSASNGALHFSYSYYISDGLTYAVLTNLTVTTTSAFATSHDQLGNPWQSVVNITGTRMYTFLPTHTTITSQVSEASSSSPATFRFYPYALLSSAPGVYTANTAPYLDASGLMLAVTPSVPITGVAPGTGPLFNTTTIAFTPLNNTAIILSEARYINVPLLALQQQLYKLL